MRPTLCLLLLMFVLLSGADRALASAPDRVLVFSRTEQFRHASIPTAVATLQQLASHDGMPADHSENAADFTPATLARHRPITRCHTVDGGRRYTGLGRDEAVCRNPLFLAQLRQGLRFAAGRSPVC